MTTLSLARLATHSAALALMVPPLHACSAGDDAEEPHRVGSVVLPPGEPEPPAVPPDTLMEDMTEAELQAFYDWIDATRRARQEDCPPQYQPQMMAEADLSICDATFESLARCVADLHGTCIQQDGLDPEMRDTVPTCVTTEGDECMNYPQACRDVLPCPKSNP